MSQDKEYRTLEEEITPNNPGQVPTNVADLEEIFMKNLSKSDEINKTEKKIYNLLLAGIKFNNQDLNKLMKFLGLTVSILSIFIAIASLT